MRLSLLLLIVAIAMPVMAKDIIYRCKNERSQGVVYQQRPCADDQIIGTDLPHRLWRQMRQLVADKTETLQQLGADVDSIKQCQARMQKLNAKTQRLAKSADVVAVKHAKIAKAYGYLKECGECRTSAISACQQADIFLNEATVDLMEY